MDPEDESEIWRDPKTGLCTEAAYNEPGELMMRILNPQDIEKSFKVTMVTNQPLTVKSSPTCSAKVMLGTEVEIC